MKMKMADGNTAVLRRNRPGTKAEMWSKWSDIAYEEMDNTLAVQQYIQQAINKDVNDVEGILNQPDGVDEGVWKYEHLLQFCMELNGLSVKLQMWSKWSDIAYEEMDNTLAVQQYIQQAINKDVNDVEGILNQPDGVDEGVWKYEHLRQFCMELNGLSVKLQAECNPETCTQMTATEQWIFLCAAHKTPKECPAIDYTRHTLDGAACLLNSNKYFPSRVSIKESSVAKLGSVCRRVYRIFSHAYFHHRTLFDEYENETNLCKRFTIFVTKYNLMSKENLIVPILDDQELIEGESEA